MPSTARATTAPWMAHPHTVGPRRIPSFYNLLSPICPGTGRCTSSISVRGRASSLPFSAVRDNRAVAVDIVPPTCSYPDRLTGSLLDLELDGNRFDLVFSYQTFEYLPEPRPFLVELLRSLGGMGAPFIHTDMETPEREAGFAD